MASGQEESGNDQDKKSGPWKRMASSEQPAPPPEPEKPVEPPPSRATTGGYVPPHLRNQTASQVSQPSRLKSKTAPDIHNEEFFPTLSGSKPPEVQGAWGRR